MGVPNAENPTTVERREDKAILRFQSEMDREHTADLWEAACSLAQGEGGVEIDFNHMTQCDVSVLQVLLALDESLRNEGRRLEATGISPALAEQWSISGYRGATPGGGK